MVLTLTVRVTFHVVTGMLLLVVSFSFGNSQKAALD